MRLNRSYRAVLVIALVGLVGSFGPAIDGTGSPSQEPTPVLSTWLDFEAQSFSIDAWGGLPGGVGVLEIVFTSGDALTLPVEFDGAGEAELSVPIATFNNGFDLLVGLRLVALASDGTPRYSGVWALQARNYIVSDPEDPPPCGQCPTTPGGWFEYVLWPGATSGPTWPHTRVAILSDEERSGGQPMLALESGPAGSFPIN